MNMYINESTDIDFNELLLYYPKIITLDIIQKLYPKTKNISFDSFSIVCNFNDLDTVAFFYPLINTELIESMTVYKDSIDTIFNNELNYRIFN